MIVSVLQKALMSADGLLCKEKKTGLYMLIANVQVRACCLSAQIVGVYGGNSGSGPLQWSFIRLLGQFLSGGSSIRDEFHIQSKCHNFLLDFFF